MASVLEQIEKKRETLGGLVYEYQKLDEDNSLTISNPKDYKDFFILEDIGIQKTLKSVLIEAKDSLCTIYYILDSSLLRLTLEMDYQSENLLKELPLSFIVYLRVLCSKKASIRLTIQEDKIFIHFEDTIVKDKEKPKVKLKRGEKREAEIGKLYILELPLREVETLDKQVIDYLEDFFIYGSLQDNKFPISVNLDSFDDTEIELPLVYSTISSDKGDFKSVYGGRLNIWYIELPVEISLINSKLIEVVSSREILSEEENLEDIYEVEDIGEEIHEKWVDNIANTVSLVDNFLIGDVEEE